MSVLLPLRADHDHWYSTVVTCEEGLVSRRPVCVLRLSSSCFFGGGKVRLANGRGGSALLVYCARVYLSYARSIKLVLLVATSACGKTEEETE